MKTFLVKLCACLSLTCLACCLLYAQHCDFIDLQARYEQSHAEKERMEKEYQRLKNQLANTTAKKADANNNPVLAITNRNPLNVKQAATKWQGQKGVDAQGHIIFESNVHGIRAAANVLMNYYVEHKIDTLQGIVDRFCTAKKAHKAKYAAFLGKRLNIKPDTKFNVLQRLPELLSAMARYESGVEWKTELFAPYSLLVAAYNKGGK